MAYQAKNLSVLAYANGFTLWHYGADDEPEAVDLTNYFEKAGDMLRTGDMILANLGADGSVSAGVFVVRSSTPDAVDVSNLTPFGAANDR
jgi:hypothetical protein